MLLCLRLSLSHLRILPFDNVFSWGAALRFRTAGRAGCCTKEAQQTCLSDAGEGSPVETLVQAKECVAMVSDQLFLRSQSDSEHLALCTRLDTLQRHSYPMGLKR